MSEPIATPAPAISEELKPCPFCGTRATPAARWILDGWANTVFCEVCEAQSGSCETARDAAQAWNLRQSCAPKVEPSAMEALRQTRDELHTLYLEGGGCDHGVGICWCAVKRALDSADAALASRLTKAEPRPPDGYAYRYPGPFGHEQSVIVFNGGGERNGSKPIETVPYWLGAPPAKAEPSAGVEQLREALTLAEPYMSADGFHVDMDHYNMVRRMVRAALTAGTGKETQR